MNKRRFIIVSLLFLLCVLFYQSGAASIFSKAKNAVSHVGNAVGHAVSSTVPAVVSVVKIPVAIVKVPVTTVVSTAKVVSGNESIGRGASTTLKSVAGIPISLGLTINSGTTVVQNFANIPFYATEETLGIAGKPGDYIGDAVTFPDELATEYSLTPLFATGDILQGQNPLEANPVSQLLATEIEAARDQYKAQAKEVPASVKLALASQYPPNILNKAKYAVVSPNVTLPTVIIACNSGEQYAVTVDNIIVFSEKPAHTVAGIRWWAHELRHVQQYDEWGVLSFAYKYTLHPVYNDATYDSSPIEQDAIERSDEAVNFLNSNPSLLQSWLQSTD